MEFTLRELAKETEMSPYAIRNWVRLGYIPRTEPRGPLTRFTDEHRLSIVAIQRLRAEGKRLPEASSIVDSASPEQLRVLAGEAPVVRAPLPPPVAPVASVPVAPRPPTVRPYQPGSARAREIWEHVPIRPGVELRVRADADSEARRVAREIEATYAVPSVTLEGSQ